MTTEQTYGGYSASALRELANECKNDWAVLVSPDSVLALLDRISELEADNARLHAIAEQAAGNAVQSARTVLEVEAQLRRADNLIALQTDALRVARRLVLAFDVGDVAHTSLNGRGYAALAELRAALEEPRDE